MEAWDTEGGRSAILCSKLLVAANANSKHFSRQVRTKKKTTKFAAFLFLFFY